VVYADEQQVVDIGTAGETVNLYAVWGDGEITLPGAFKWNDEFEGWYIGDVKIGGQGDSYKPNTSVTLKAKWKSDVSSTYTVMYDGNGATAGATASSTHERNVYKKLTPNGFSRNYTIEFDANGGSCATASLASNYTFGGWALSATGAAAYGNEENVRNITDSDRITLYAVWNDGGITLPTPTWANHNFRGWFTAASGGDYAGAAGSVYRPESGRKLYAQWEEDVIIPVVDTSQVRVLEIEPYKNYMADSEWTTKIRDLYGNGVTYSVRRMTTAEFIVNTDDLVDTYDLIYFGIDRYTSADYYKTVNAQAGNDDSTYYSSFTEGDLYKAGWAYAHVGPVWYIKYSRANALKSPYTDIYKIGDNKALATRMAGNDLTSIKYNQLMEFADAQGLIVFGAGFLSGNSVNSDKVDPSSYVYKLANTHIGVNGYVYLDKTYSKDTNLKRKAAKYVSFAVYSQPPTYSFSGEGDAPDTCYINGENNDYRTLSFTFKVNDNGSLSSPYLYKIGLYVDLNADGRFDSSDAEHLHGFTIYDSTAGKNIYEDSALYSQHTYTLSRDVSELVGIVPWKLELTRSTEKTDINGNAYLDPGKITTAITGFSAIRAKTTEKETIRVLQIYQGVGADSCDFSYDGYQMSYMLPTTSDLINICLRKTGSSLADFIRNNGLQGTDKYVMTNSYETGSLSLAKFYDYCRTHLTEADFTKKDIRFFDSSGYGFYFSGSNGGDRSWDYSVNAYSVANVNSGHGLPVTAKFYTLLKNLNEFNVYIDRLSCASYEDYVASGRSLLNDYDMVILGFGDGYADLNTSACNDLNRFISAGKTALFTHDTTSFSNTSYTQAGVSEGKTWRDDWLWSYYLNRYFRSALALDRYNIYGKNPSLYTSDVAKLGASGTVANYTNQGFVDALQGGNITTTKVARINRGTITEYPYTLAETITVSETHQQYYQLDLENPNVVVWYSLASNSNSSVYKTNEKDARNYYYIYNVGNVTYSGAGHRLGSLSSTPEIINEIKLFVNTIVAAYRASGAPVETVITNDDKTSGENIDYLYIDFDSTNTELAIGDGVYGASGSQTKRVFFTVDNNSIIETKGITVNYEIKNEAGTYVKENWETYLKGTTTAVEHTTSGTVNYYKVEDGKEYYFDLPLELISRSSSMMIKITTTITYGSTEDGSLTQLTTEKYVELLRRGFFELD
jgi:hypothetical protein